MSAVNIFLGADRVSIWTDGALYDADGTLLQVNNKVGMLPHLNCAVTVRGPAPALPLLLHHLGSTFGSFDTLALGLGEAVRHVVKMHAAILGLCSHGCRFQVWATGFSGDRGRPEIHYAHSDQPDAVEQLPLVMAPADEALIARMVAEFPDATDADLLRPEIGQRIMEMQRDMRLEQVEGAGLICAVGGFSQLTVVTPDRISTEIVRRWPDRIGEKMGDDHEAQ